MVRTLILIMTKRTARVADKIKAIDGVKDAFEVTGMFDAGALVEVESVRFRRASPEDPKR